MGKLQSIQNYTQTKIWPHLKKKLVELRPTLSMWVCGYIGAATAHQNLATQSSQMTLILAGLAASLFWKPAIAIATAGSMLTLLWHFKVPIPTEPMGQMLSAWFLWFVIKLWKKEPTGLADSASPFLIALLGIWMMTSGHRLDAHIIPNLLLGIALIAAGHHGRIGIVLCYFLYAQDANFGRNLTGHVHTISAAGMLTTPGFLGKGLALIPTWAAFHTDSSAGKLGCATLWVAYFGGWIYEKIPKRYTKFVWGAGAVGGITAAATFPIWTDFILRKLDRDPTFTGRVPMWQHAMEWVQLKPTSGWGTNFWSEHGNSWFWSYWFDAGTHAHNSLIQHTLHFGVPAGILILLLIFLTCLHRNNSWKAKAGLAGAWIPTMSGIAGWTMPNCIWMHTTLGATGDTHPGKERVPPGKPWVPSKKTLGILAGTCLIIAAVVWKIIPSQSTQLEELWLVRHHPVEAITGENKTKPVERIIRKTKEQIPGVQIDHRENGMIIHIAAAEKSKIDQAAQLAQQEHQFLRVLPRAIKESHLRTKLLLCLVLPILLLLGWLHNRTLWLERTTGALVAAMWVCFTPDPKTITSTIPFPETQWTWNGEGNQYQKRWEFEYAHQLRLSLMARHLDSTQNPTYYQYYDTQKRQGNLGRETEFSDEELQHAKTFAEETLREWKSLPYNPERPFDP